MKKQSKALKALSAALVLLALGSTGCANHMGFTPEDSLGLQTSPVRFASPDNSGKYSCPGQYNVTKQLSHDTNFDGTTDYRVCVDEDDASILLVTGTRDHEVCVFPAVFQSSTAVFTNQLPSGQMLARCDFVPGFEGVEMAFAGTDFNAVFIVPADQSMQMQACLKAAVQLGHYLFCPEFSFGLLPEAKSNTLGFN